MVRYWIGVRDGDDRVRGLYHRHYSRHHYKDGRNPKKFMGPGEYMVLLTLDCRATFAWRKFIDNSGQKGVNCAFFRNEGDILSSDLISEAMQLAWIRWPGERLYSYVNEKKIRSHKFGKKSAGWCFLKAGWVRSGFTQGGLLILEANP